MKGKLTMQYATGMGAGGARPPDSVQIEVVDMLGRLVVSVKLEPETVAKLLMGGQAVTVEWSTTESLS